MRHIFAANIIEKEVGSTLTKKYKINKNNLKKILRISFYSSLTIFRKVNKI